MVDQLLHILWIGRVKDVHEVLPVDLLAFREPLWHVDHDLGVVLNLGQEVDNTELVKLWDSDEFNFVHFQKLLVFVQDGSQVVLANAFLVRKIEF